MALLGKNLEPAGQGTRRLMRSFALTRGLWQASAPGEGGDGEGRLHVALMQLPFEEELLEALGKYWRGALRA